MRLVRVMVYFKYIIKFMKVKINSSLNHKKIQGGGECVLEG